MVGVDGGMHGPEHWPERARRSATQGTRPPGALPVGYSRSEGMSSRDLPVLVRLDVLLPLQDGATPPADEELTAGAWRPASAQEAGDVGSGVKRRGRLLCTGEVRGLLHHWERRVEGDWIAVVSYSVPLAGDPRPGIAVHRAPVPAHAVRPL